MKKISFSHDPKVVAMQVLEISNDTGVCLEEIFGLVPREIHKTEQFWTELIARKTEAINFVPEMILKSLMFWENVDSVKFYKAIPSELKTEEDYRAYKKRKDSGEYICTEYYKKYVQLTDGNFTWYYLDRKFYRQKEIPLNLIINEVMYYPEKLKDYPEEIWSQDVANYIWYSKIGFECFEYIPKEYVKHDWIQIMELLEKRISYFGIWDDGIPMDTGKIPEYWSSFESLDQIRVALELEKRIKERNSGETIPFHKLEEYRKNKAKINEDFRTMLGSLKVKNQEVADGLYAIYGQVIASNVSESLFNINWLREELISEIDEYLEAMEEMELYSGVEKLEAEDYVNEILQRAYIRMHGIRPEITNREAKKLFEKIVALEDNDE